MDWTRKYFRTENDQDFLKHKAKVKVKKQTVGEKISYQKVKKTKILEK